MGLTGNGLEPESLPALPPMDTLLAGAQKPKTDRRSTSHKPMIALWKNKYTVHLPRR